jgi:hypothetical protein
MGRETGLFIPYWMADRFLDNLLEVEERRPLAPSPTEHPRRINDWIFSETFLTRRASERP